MSRRMKPEFIDLAVVIAIPCGVENLEVRSFRRTNVQENHEPTNPRTHESRIPDPRSRLVRE
jgi:hypothetical protein